uniref:Predicted gene, 17617 n=1 Tax=Peromyscus maniculatus bairdii TaxID=230844 RepID=A0A8C8W3X6_PERMB
MRTLGAEIPLGTQ